MYSEFIEDGVTGRLRYDVMGNRFYECYKPLIDKLVWQVGTASTPETRQQYQSDLSSLLQIEAFYREHYMFEQLIATLVSELEELSKLRDSLNSHLHIQKERNQKLKNIVSEIDRIKKAQKMIAYSGQQITQLQSTHRNTQIVKDNILKFNQEVNTKKDSIDQGYGTINWRLEKEIAEMEKELAKINKQKEELKAKDTFLRHKLHERSYILQSKKLEQLEPIIEKQYRERILLRGSDKPSSSNIRIVRAQAKQLSAGDSTFWWWVIAAAAITLLIYQI